MATTVNLDEIIDYYVNLLIIQYNDKEKARATIDLYIRQLLSNGIIFDISCAFDPKTAIGVQLDVIGKYVALDRFFLQTVISDGDYFGMIDYDGSSTALLGMTDYANYDTDNGQFLTYNDIEETSFLSDDDYRILINLRIIQNNSNHSRGSIDEGLFAFFGTSLFASSNGNMKMAYFATADLFLIASAALEKGVLPKPMGVKLEGVIKKTKKFFAFTNYNKNTISNNVTGFSNYSNFGIKQGECLTYDKLITP